MTHSRPSAARSLRSVLPAIPVILALGLAACDIDVANPNEPDLAHAFASGVEVEAHIAAAFHDWYRVQTGRPGMGNALSAVSFQHSTRALCDAPYAEIPRGSVENDLGRTCTHSMTTWEGLYRALARVANGLTVLEVRPGFRDELGHASMDRLVAFGRFVQGLAHGDLALLYDRAAILDETTERTTDSELLAYGAVLAVALDRLDEAAALADGATWSIPAAWASMEIPADRLARLARSHAARLRASVARTPAERLAVDWAAVLTDAGAGITGDWVLGGSQDWGATTLFTHHRLRPTMAPYFILGMADQSGSFQRWLDRPLFDRRPHPQGEDPILIVTADTRFPRGATVDEQVAEGGTLFVIPTNETVGTDTTYHWQTAERGPWRWSYYRYEPAIEYGNDISAAGFWPIMTAAELRLLRAEALYRIGDVAGAAALVNESRTAHGLAPTDAAGANTDCVPRLPDGACGDLLEMLKWEKRLETMWVGPFLASWFFDGRGWGDLHAGTFVQLPVPCSELTVLRLDCYTFGGDGDHGSPGSQYAWPFEEAGAG